MSAPAVTVYIPCHQYGRFLQQAVDSVLAQTREDWELLIIDDGSTDETAAVAAACQAVDPRRIRVITHPRMRGLQASANAALRAARGRYVMRLDADDFLDDNALLVLASHLDRHPEVALVYPNYLYVDEGGGVLGVEQRKRIGQEAQLLDLPAHGAGTLIRRRVLKSLGGYDERHDSQDGYELWLKVLARHRVASVPTPLFCYRQHAASLTQDQDRLLRARSRIKRDAVARGRGGRTVRAVAVVTAKNTYRTLPDIVLKPLAGQPLIDYTLEPASRTHGFEAILVTTDDPRVVAHCAGKPGVTGRLRPAELSGERVLESQVVDDAIRWLEREQGLSPDIIVALSVHAPLRRPEHIQEAIDTLILYNTDSVLSVYEDYGLHYAHGRRGLEPLNPAMHRQVRLEREALFVDNGAVKACWRRVLTAGSLLGEKVGHIVMPRRESYQIKAPFDVWLIEQILLRRQQEGGSPERQGATEVTASHRVRRRTRTPIASGAKA